MEARRGNVSTHPGEAFPNLCSAPFGHFTKKNIFDCRKRAESCKPTLRNMTSNQYQSMHIFIVHTMMLRRGPVRKCKYTKLSIDIWLYTESHRGSRLGSQRGGGRCIHPLVKVSPLVFGSVW